LFVGINPGLRSAAVGHHFAGHSNRFWKLLWDARLVPSPLSYRDDVRLPGWGIGLTNIIARPSRGVDSLDDAQYVAGVRRLTRVIRRYRPSIVAILGVTIFRMMFPQATGRLQLGLQRERLAGVRVMLLPNPSGRNAHYSYESMRRAYTGLRRWGSGLTAGRR
jgi:TDG/mug DNA glycosylase family protein